MSRARASIPVPAPLIVAAAVAGAALVGAAMALSLKLGLAAAVAMCFAPLALLNLQLAIVLWLPSVALIAVTALGVGPNLAGIMILLAWFGALAGRSRLALALSRNAPMLIPVVVLLVWVMVSMAWAREPAFGSGIFFAWVTAGAIAVVLSTTLADRRYIRLAIAALIAGTVVSVLLGVLGGAVQEPSAGSAEATGRIVGGSGDPNFLAAGTVAAIVLAAGIGIGSPRLIVRLLLLGAIAILTIGLAASASRGGSIAALAAAVAVVALARNHRAWAVAFLLCVAGVALAWFSADPAAWQRLSDLSESSGRTELWSVAWQMWLDHPVGGVGLEGFVDNAGEYVRDLGSLEFAEFLTEQPKVVHNLYLQLLAETGIVGLTLYLVVVAASVRAAWGAAKLFERLGDMAMAALARSVIAADVAMLASATFISGATDRRLWVLLALGPALLVCARQMDHPGGERVAPGRMRRIRRRSPMGVSAPDTLRVPVGPANPG